MSFKGRSEPTNPLFKKLEIMKFKDILLYYNCLFAYNQMNENLPENFIKYRAATEWNQISKKLNTKDKSQVIKSLREQIFNTYN